MITQDTIDRLGNTFLLPRPPAEFYRVYFKGNPITTSLNTTLWLSKEHAKAALINHVIININFISGLIGSDGHFNVVSFVEELEGRGIIQYEKVLIGL